MTKNSQSASTLQKKKSHDQQNKLFTRIYVFVYLFARQIPAYIKKYWWKKGYNMMRQRHKEKKIARHIFKVVAYTKTNIGIVELDSKSSSTYYICQNEFLYHHEKWNVLRIRLSLTLFVSSYISLLQLVEFFIFQKKNTQMITYTQFRFNLGASLHQYYWIQVISRSY